MRKDVQPNESLECHPKTEGWLNDLRIERNRCACLPNISHRLFILQETTSPNQTLTLRPGGAWADLSYLLLDISDGSGRGDLDLKRMGVRWELNSDCGRRHETGDSSKTKRGGRDEDEE